jgi:hypothetical protein
VAMAPLPLPLAAAAARRATSYRRMIATKIPGITMSPRPSMENWRLPSPAGSAHPGSRGGGFTQLSNQQGGQTARQRSAGRRPTATSSGKAKWQSSKRTQGVQGAAGEEQLDGGVKVLGHRHHDGGGKHPEDVCRAQVGRQRCRQGGCTYCHAGCGKQPEDVRRGQGWAGREEGGAGACQAGRCGQARWQAGVCVPLKQADSPPAASRWHAGSMVAATTGSSHGHPNTHRRRRGRRGG